MDLTVRRKRRIKKDPTFSVFEMISTYRNGAQSKILLGWVEGRDKGK